MNWKNFFSGKKVTIMGLGLLGRGLGDAVFLAECGAELIVTDLRDRKTLASSLAKLKKFKNIRYTLGRHKRADFRNRDFILKAAGVALDSTFIAEAKKNGIPIEMDASLFARLLTSERSDGGQANLAPRGVTIIGITGTRGKSTTAECVRAILKTAKKRVFLGGVVHTATLPLLKKVRAGDIVVLELDSWQLQGFHDVKISPQTAVFTTFMDDHLLYYKGDRKRYFEDKTAIFKYQKKDDMLVVGESVASRIRPLLKGLTLNRGKGQTLKIARAADLPKSWKLKILGEHNRENVACAVAAAQVLGIADSVIKRAVEAFRGVPGRLEYLRTVRGVKIYNDNNATTPDATIAALRALNSKSETLNPKQIPNSKSLNAIRYTLHTTRKRVVLIIGGTDKGLDMSKLVAEIPKHCKAAVFLKETGTDKLLATSRQLLGKDFKKLSAKSYQLKATKVYEVDTLQECVEKAMKLAERSDIVLFSPAFASFGKWFENEYDRGEQFVALIKKL